MPYIGAHMSISGEPCMSLFRGKEAGCEVIQIFTRNQRKWFGKKLSEDEIADFFSAREKTGVNPVAIHTSYLINVASPDPDGRKKALSLLLDEMKWAELLDIPYLVLHPGSHMGEGEKRGLTLVADTLNRANDKRPDYSVKILLETTAGQGTNLGYRFEHLAEILDMTESAERVAICFDTCHSFAAGYDFSTKTAYRQLINEFDKILGTDQIKAFHINDSKTSLGSRRDRHNHPGEGFIGLHALSWFLNDPAFKERPFLLETPKGKDENGQDMDTVNLKILRGIINK